jgi:4-hydroxybenzoate polyprenyltransferase
LLKELLWSMRPYQWYKNLIVFIGIIFSYNFFNLEMWLHSLFAFAAFCLISGSVYIVNDIKDIDTDKLHPRKRLRPIAAGALSPRAALLSSLLMMFISVSASLYVSRSLSYIELFYIIINLLYTFYLKLFALIDVMVIAVGFVLRAIAGSVVINVQASPWLILSVFLMAFVLAFGKRRHELLVASSSRASLSQYSDRMVEDLLIISISMLLMSYALYSFYLNIYMMATLPFAFYGVFRFVQLIHTNNFGGEVEFILADRVSLVNLVLWTISVMAVLYEVHK